MKKYQDILRDQTSRNLAAKKASTSILMLPLRLETRIMNKPMDTTDEPERVQDAFIKLHNVIFTYHAMASSNDKTQTEELTKDLKLAIRDAISFFETLDLLYSEDKSYLKDLANNIYHTLNTVELQDEFAPLLDTLDDITRLTTYSDKPATNMLNELEHLTRALENTAKFPKFDGWKRRSQPTLYSQTARLRLAEKRYKEINSWFEPKPSRKIVSMAHGIGNGMITRMQCAKFSNLICRMKKAIGYPNKDYTVLTNAYPDYTEGKSRIENRGGYSQSFIFEKWGHDFLLDAAKELHGNLSSFIRNDYVAVLNELNSKVMKKTSKGAKPCATRYTLLVSKILGIELLFAKAMAAKNKGMRRAAVKEAYRRLEKLNVTVSTTYFTYGVQREFVKLLVDVVRGLSNNQHPGLIVKACDGLRGCKSMKEGTYLKSTMNKCLCLRIYPDVVALSQAIRQISREEYLAGKDFWLKYIFNEDEKCRQSLWLAISELYPPYRAAFILKRTYPKTYFKVMCRKAKDFHDKGLAIEDFIKEIDENFVNSFPTTYVDNGEQLFSVPATNLLPDRFVVHAAVRTKINASRTIVQYGHRLPKTLQVGLDLNNLETAVESKDVENGKQLYLNGGLRWMTDYDEAERLGMAITIPLDGMKIALKNTVRKFEFHQIIVYGVNEAGKDEAGKMIEDLLTSSLYSDKDMDIISFETASNIITKEDAKYAFDSSEEKQRERFQHQAYNCVHPYKPVNGNDLDILERLFCLKESILGNICEPGDVGTTEVALQRKVNRMMIEYLTGSSLGAAVNPLLAAIKNNPTLFDYLCNDVLPRGPFPMLRIGDQPYGILPVCDFRNLAVGVGSPLVVVKKILLELTEHWNNILNENVVTCYGKDSDNKETTVTTQDYLDILGSTPRSTSFYKRLMVKGGIIDAEYFRSELYQHQMKELTKIAQDLKLISDGDSARIKSIIPNYDYIPVKCQDPNTQDDACFAMMEAIDIDNIVSVICSRIKNEQQPSGIQLSDSAELIRSHVIEFFDIFNYRLDAWLMGFLNNKIRMRMNRSSHGLALGCFGWLFNLREEDDFKLVCTNEYIIAPSINQAVTGAILRSSYNNSLKNGKARNYDMGVNLSSERVRTAIRIIEGIQNGLSLGCILGADMERLIHEAYTPDLELDSCIYKLRQDYPLMKNDTDDVPGGSPANITVLNGASLLDDYAARKPKGKNAITDWLKDDLQLFNGNSKQNKKIEALIEIIDIIDDEKDALTDVVLSESVYKLTQGNTEASTAISQALKELKNIPMPEVAEIPITSAQIDAYMLAMLPTEAICDQPNSLLASIEPKVEAWLRQMMHHPADIYLQAADEGIVPLSLGDLGISASEMVYLSADKSSFTHFVEVLSWMKTGKYSEYDSDGCPDIQGDDIHAFGECEMAIDELRKVLAAARPLTNDDLVKNTGLPSEAVYGEMSNEYHHAVGYITRLLADMQQLMERQVGMQYPEDADYDMAALPDDMVAEAVRILLDCYRTGNTMALDFVTPNIFIGQREPLDGVVEWKETVQAQHALFQSIQTVSENMQAKLAEADKMIAADAEHKHTTYVQAIKTVLVSGYLVVPSFYPDGNVPVADLADQSARMRFENIDAMDLEAMVGDLALVEQPMMNFHQVRLFQKCDDINAPRIVPMQLASVEDNTTVRQWLGTAVANEEDVRDAFTYIVMNPEHFVTASTQQNPLLAGMVIDHWVERIPYREQTAAVAFGYDQPDAEAPQTLLLALATKDNRKGWNEKMLSNAIKSAIHMAKCRTVSPDLLCKDGWASGLFPLLEYKDPKKN